MTEILGAAPTVGRGGSSARRSGRRWGGGRGVACRWNLCSLNVSNVAKDLISLRRRRRRGDGISAQVGPAGTASAEPSRAEPNYVISRRIGPTSYTWTLRRRRKWTLLSLRPAFEHLQCCIAADRTLTCLEFINSMPRSWHTHQLQGDRGSVYS